MPSKKTFVPSHDMVLIRRAAEEPKKKGGIVLQDSAKEKPAEGIVLAAGPGRVLDNGQLRKVGVKEGDHVMFGKFAGSEIVIDDEKLMLMRDEEIYGKLVEKP